jgi:hypothetical protein
MIDIKIHVKDNDKYVAAMVKALSFQAAPNLIARSASVKGATMDKNGHFTLHMADSQHHSKFAAALSKYLAGLAEIISN